MKKNNLLCLILLMGLFFANNLFAQTQHGYYTAPYVRYEADQATLAGGAVATTKSYAQANLQSEASGQICVTATSTGASVEWTVSAAADGLVVRYSVPDNESGSLQVLVDNALVGTLTLTSFFSWEYLSTNGDPNNNGVTNTNPKMRFDEVRMKLPSQIAAGGKLKLVRVSGNISIDFAELEAVPTAITAPGGSVTYTGDGSTLQTFINQNGGKTIYLPTGTYNVGGELYFGVDNTVLKGAGMWYTEIHFTGTGNTGGLRANATDISFSDFYLTTVRNSRSNSYNGINGVFTSGSTIKNVWTEHFECGAWIGQYNTGSVAFADGFTASNCRFRNSYADGINLCKGTSNAIVEYCSFRNNGDDDMAIWSANGLECKNNTFRYNTSENCWRASGCAIYGGQNNKAHHLLIKDNLEAGIRVNNSFAGVGFNDNGMHEFSDITIIGCGTFNDLYYSQVGAIDIAVTNIAGTRVKNVSFTNINLVDSKNDAIFMNKRSGEGFYNLVFTNVTINGTGKEFPNNDATSKGWGRGYGLLIAGNPSGAATYCNLTYSNRGGNATTNENKAAIGTLTWTSDCSGPSPTSITSAATFGICTSPITFTATTTASSANTVSYIEFYVDNVSIGQDNAFPYAMNWNSPSGGNHQVKAVAYFSGGTNAPSALQTINVVDGIFSTPAAPSIDGVVDVVWNNYKPFSINLVSQGTVTNANDLSATFKIARDASNLYILVDVTDDILRNAGTYNWQKDAIELYIDMGNDKTGSYVTGNDFQYTFVWNVSTPQSGVTFAQTTKTGGTSGYIMEIKLPWATLGGAPSAGSYMGIDVHVEDNDTDNGQRSGKKAWADGTDNAWNTTAVLGTLQIAGCTNTYFPSAVQDFTNGEDSPQIYPNPFSAFATLLLPEGNGQNFSATLIDINGKQIWTKNLEGGSFHSVGDDLAPGVYILEVEKNNSRQTMKLIKL